eukprot:359818-Chlamydomonas_euryale.AAC.1
MGSTGSPWQQGHHVLCPIVHGLHWQCLTAGASCAEAAGVARHRKLPAPPPPGCPAATWSCGPRRMPSRRTGEQMCAEVPTLQAG